MLTGYLPSTAYVAIAVDAIAQCRSKNQQPLILCDPVIGDDPKGVYIEIEAATAIRDQLIQFADIVTPNRFELAWLTGSPVACTATATAAAAKLRRPIIIATSIPFESNRLANVAVTPTNSDYVAVTRRTSAPNGTGDLLSALFLAAYLENDRKVVPALARATAAIEAVLSASNGHHELRLIQSQDDWLRQLVRSAN